MANGAGWSALGAAILGGNQGFLGAQREQIIKSQADARLQMEALQRQLMQQQIDQAPLHQQGLETANTAAGLNLEALKQHIADLPKQQALGDFNTSKSAVGEDWRNDPNTVDLAAKAGITMPRQDIQLARVKGIESGAGGLVPTTSQQADLMGVAPNTGVSLPSDLILKKKNEARQGALDDAQLAAFKNAFGGGSGGFEVDEKGAPLDTPGNRQKGTLLGANDPIAKMYGPAGQSPANVAARKTAEIEAELKADPDKGTKTNAHTMPSGEIVYTKTDRHGRITRVDGPQASGFSSATNPRFGPDAPHGDEFLKTLDPKEQAVIKQYKEFRGIVPTGQALTKPEIVAREQLLQQYDPEFSWQQYGIRQKLRSNYETSGKAFDQITALNKSINHLDQLATSGDDLGNFNSVPLLNTALNAGKQALATRSGGQGQANLNKFNTDALTAATEVAKFLKGSGALSKEEVMHWLDKFKSTDGKLGRDAAVREAIALLGKQADTLAVQWKNEMKTDFPVYTPETMGILGKRKWQDVAGADAEVGSQSAPPAGKIIVTDPAGNPHPFDTPVQAEAFKKLAGIK